MSTMYDAASTLEQRLEKRYGSLLKASTGPCVKLDKVVVREVQ